DRRSVTLASNFVLQWLDMKRLDEIVPDSAVFPYASGRSDPRDDFRTELTLFADSIFRDDRSVVDLLRAKHTYLNERVALHYGITDVKGDRFRRVELKDSARWGLLGKGAVLMAAAYPNRTSPVLRGKFILEHIEGVPTARRATARRICGTRCSGGPISSCRRSPKACSRMRRPGRSSRGTCRPCAASSAAPRASTIDSQRSFLPWSAASSSECAGRLRP